MMTPENHARLQAAQTPEEIAAIEAELIAENKLVREKMLAGLTEKQAREVIELQRRAAPHQKEIDARRERNLMQTHIRIR